MGVRYYLVSGITPRALLYWQSAKVLQESTVTKFGRNFFRHGNPSTFLWLRSTSQFPETKKTAYMIAILVTVICLISLTSFHFRGFRNFTLSMSYAMIKLIVPAQIAPPLLYCVYSSCTLLMTCRANCDDFHQLRLSPVRFRAIALEFSMGVRFR